MFHILTTKSQHWRHFSTTILEVPEEGFRCCCQRRILLATIIGVWAAQGMFSTSVWSKEFVGLVGIKVYSISNIFHQMQDWRSWSGQLSKLCLVQFQTSIFLSRHFFQHIDEHLQRHVIAHSNAHDVTRLLVATPDAKCFHAGHRNCTTVHEMHSFRTEKTSAFLLCASVKFDRLMHVTSSSDATRYAVFILYKYVFYLITACKFSV